MDAKTITEKSKALMKATSSGELPAIILGILNELKIGVVANEDILRSTRIGVTVNKSKQHKNPEVARLAGEIVRKWRDDIQKQKPITPNGTNKMNGTPRNSTASPAPNQDTKSKPTSSVPPAERNWRKDKANIHHTGQSTRDNCIGLIYDGLVHLSNIPSSTVLSVAIAIEGAAFHTLGPEDKEPYKAKMRSLYQNLKNKSNPSLRVRVLNGDVKPEQFVVMSHEELKSAERRQEDEKIKNENMRAAQAPQAEKSISTSLTCGKCGQKKVSYSQAQTRSADEPMTTFCECTVCGKRWKVSLTLPGK
ncbi:RNA polymerase II elongation factor [Ptychographa xylographoides]|nr:RNA polymerase II elongation factor [Ptychographa xylographoides]